MTKLFEFTKWKTLFFVQGERKGLDFLIEKSKKWERQKLKS